MEDLDPDVVADGVGFAEGPVLAQDGSVWATAMDQSRLVRVGRSTSGDRVESSVAVGGAPNGLTEGADGRLFVAQCGATSFPGGVQVVDPDGSVRFLCRPGAGTPGPRSPNDLCVGPDGWLWVTDPTRPLGSGSGRIWRCDPGSGRAQEVAALDWYPNGIGFGPDDDEVFVARTGQGQVVRFPIRGTAHGARLGPPDVVVQMDRGEPDGFAFDADGRLVVAAVELEGDRPGTIQTWEIAGPPTLVDRFEPAQGRLCTNVALGADRRLVVTDASGGRVLAFADRPAPGLALHPFRTS